MPPSSHIGNPSPFPARLAKLGLGLLKRCSKVARFLPQTARLARCTFLNPLQLLPKRSLGIHHVRAPSGVKRPRNPHQLGARDRHFFLELGCSCGSLVHVLSEDGAALLQVLPADAAKDSGVHGSWVALLQQKGHELELQPVFSIEWRHYAHP